MAEEALLAALARSDTPAALALIPSLSKFDAREPSGKTALHLACRHSLVAVAEALLQAGAPVNIHNYYGQSVLMDAMMANCTEIVRMLIDAGADLEITDINGRTALHWACRQGCANLVNLLLQAGCCPNPRTDNSLTPLHLAVAWGFKETVALLLDTAPYCALDVDINGYNALHYAARYNSCIEAVYARCKVIDAVTNDGETALQIAEKYGNTEAAKLLRAWVVVPRRLAFLAGSCLNPANLPATTRLASLPIDILRLIVKKV